MQIRMYSKCFCLFLSEFQKIYDRLGATIVERGESFYHKLMPDVVRELDEKSEYLD